MADEICTTEDREQFQANARLIVAAPDLLSIVHRLKDIHDNANEDMWHQLTDLMFDVDAALAKVEGHPDAARKG